jgi:glycosyltransferase involved in cell wall biosynthesis
VTERLVSVVIPARDAAPFVRGAVESVLSQTYEPVEVIVVDDNSRDETPAILASISDERVRVRVSGGAGVGRARNAGFEMARGGFVAFLDADDLWLPDKVERQVSIFSTRPDVVAVGCFMRYESLHGRTLGVGGQPVSPDDQARIAAGSLMPFPLSSVLFKAEALRSTGGFDESLATVVPGLVEDIDLLARVAAVGTVACVEKILGVYRVHGASASARHFRSQRLGTRFVRARLAARAEGRALSWEEFAASFRPSFRQSYGDFVQGWYRAAGVSAADGRWGRALATGVLALLANPRYVVSRLSRQQRLRFVR